MKNWKNISFSYFAAFTFSIILYIISPRSPPTKLAVRRKIQKLKINSVFIKYYWKLLILGKKMKKMRSSKISNKILSSSGPNHIFEILLPTSSSSEKDQSDRFFAKANEPLFKLRKLKRRNEKKGKINL